MVYPDQALASLLSATETALCRRIFCMHWTSRNPAWWPRGQASDYKCKKTPS